MVGFEIVDEVCKTIDGKRVLCTTLTAPYGLGNGLQYIGDYNAD